MKNLFKKIICFFLGHRSILKSKNLKTIGLGHTYTKKEMLYRITRGPRRWVEPCVRCNDAILVNIIK
jgi:hypothetical protein